MNTASVLTLSSVTDEGDDDVACVLHDWKMCKILLTIGKNETADITLFSNEDQVFSIL